jgi:hypothetical protein
VWSWVHTHTIEHLLAQRGLKCMVWTGHVDVHTACSTQWQRAGRVAQRGQRRATADRSMTRCSRDPSMGYEVPAGQGLGLKVVKRMIGDRGAGAHRHNDGVVALRRGGWGPVAQGAALSAGGALGPTQREGRGVSRAVHDDRYEEKQRWWRQAHWSGQEVNGMDEMQGQGSFYRCDTGNGWDAWGGG